MTAAEASTSALSFSESVQKLIRRVSYVAVSNSRQKEAVFRLRYQGYLRESFISPTADQQLSDKFEEIQNARTFAVYIDGELASSIRIHVLTKETPVSLSAEVFGDVLAPFLDRGYVIVDPSRFVVDHALARAFPALPYVTVRLAYMAVEHYDADMVIASTRIDHQAFYRRVFLLQPMCGARFYASLTKAFTLMGADDRSLLAKIAARYPFFRSGEADRRVLFAPWIEPAEIPRCGVG